MVTRSRSRIPGIPDEILKLIMRIRAEEIFNAALKAHDGKEPEEPDLYPPDGDSEEEADEWENWEEWQARWAEWTIEQWAMEAAHVASRRVWGIA